MAGNKLPWQVGVPQVIRLQRVQGQPSPSKFGGQEYRHDLIPDGHTYLGEEAERAIQELSIRPGEAVEVLKMSADRWVARRPSSSSTAAVSAPQGHVIPQNTQPNATTHTAQPVPVPPIPSQPIPIPPNSATTVATKLTAGALISAIDAVAIAREYGARRGFTLEFSAEDVRALAATCLIQYWKSNKEYAA